MDTIPIARLRYTRTCKPWPLRWRDRNLRLQEYDQIAPTSSIIKLLEALGHDPT